MSVKPIAFAIFAHPDDEAFGPSGTLAILSETHDVYLVCATRGEAGENHSGVKGNIFDIRERELRASATILGIKDVFFLGFKDGELCNNLYHKVAEKIQNLVNKFKPSLFVTVEHHGVSGHLDHIAISFISTYVYRKSPTIKEIWYNCVDRLQSVGTRNYFVYFPPGYKTEDIDKTVDVSSVWNKKIAAINAHVSQQKDGKRVLIQMKALHILRGFKKYEFFLVSKK
ncbi:hypothetical protein COY90_00990 [Candidatus Roizmanbacteria bacterium CG_4_10_14_0_8_um_filter_39_9]|uniref:PIG-L family deacetylase n=1 Tax=Candidatus Roizmanbacteria bacterium CG_4_10_14_0_8_um_filter_39_9 TaxID=1974829 RepID=A0A2M7QDS5_9BACT|nr:MAG: hypothetical protein COY90_00990 [Candidatus Roizmanbacteria bacterium CG_4_10_14_0_8_um_filter_39_9]